MKNAMTLMLAGLILFLPNQLHFPTTFGIPGLNAFNLLFLGALAMTLACMTTRDGGTSERPPLTTPLLVYYGVLGVAVVFGLAGGTADPYEDIAIYKTAVTYSMLYFIAYYAVQDLRSIRILLGVMLFVFAVASLEAIREGIAYGFGGYAHEERAAGPFGHGSGQSNFAGVFYGIFATLAFGIAILGRKIRPLYRLVALGCYGLGGLAILATYSRQAFLIIGVTTLLIALRRNPILAVAAVACMLAYPLWAPEGVVDRIDMTTEETTTGHVELEDSAASRYELWDGAWQLMKDNPLGIGFNQFQEDVEPYLPGWVTARDAQNMYLRIGAEAGFLGLLVFIWLLVSMFGIGRRLRSVQGSQEAQMLGTTIKFAVLAVAMGNIYSSTFFSGEVMANVWILLGLMSKYHFLAVHEAEEHGVPQTMVDRLESMRQVYARWQARSPEVES